MTETNMLAIAEKFALEGTIAEIKALGDGFINDTFIVKTEGDTPNYILQRKNHQIFPDVPGMMDNIQRVCRGKELSFLDKRKCPKEEGV